MRTSEAVEEPPLAAAMAGWTTAGHSPSFVLGDAPTRFKGLPLFLGVRIMGDHIGNEYLASVSVPHR